MTHQSPQAHYKTLLSGILFPDLGSGLSLSIVRPINKQTQTFAAFYTKAKDIALYIDIQWEKGLITLSQRIRNQWSAPICVDITMLERSLHIDLVPLQLALQININGGNTIAIQMEVPTESITSLRACGSWSYGFLSAPNKRASSYWTKLPHSPHTALSRNASLIFDMGMHNGDDTDFYLKKGFTVVALEANPTMCEQAARRFPDALNDGRLTICNIGIAPSKSRLPFYVNENVSVWSSFDKNIASRGHPVQAVEVATYTSQDLFECFGIPYYVKIDIEGFDHLVIDYVATLNDKPHLLSFENGDLAHFEQLAKSGYRWFQLVEQSAVPMLTLPATSCEGLSVPHLFNEGSSGPFGSDLPGEWLNVNAMKRKLLEHHRLLSQRAVRGYDWWDLHAKLS